MSEQTLVREEEISARQGSRTGRWVVLAGGLLVLMALAFGLLSQRSPEQREAPTFSVSLFDGGEISLAQLRGQVVVINFWASWCGPCREEAPDLERVWREYRDHGVSFIGINLKDTRTQAQAFLEEHGLTYPNGADPYGRIAKSYRVYGLPETFVITRDGEIANRFIGAVTERQLLSILEEIL